MKCVDLGGRRIIKKKKGGESPGYSSTARILGVDCILSEEETPIGKYFQIQKIKQNMKPIFSVYITWSSQQNRVNVAANDNGNDCQ